MTKLKSTNFDKSQKIQIVTTRKIFKCDKTKKNTKYDKTKKTQIATKLKNSHSRESCDRSDFFCIFLSFKVVRKKNSKTQIVTKLKTQFVIKLGQNSKAQIVTKHKTQSVTIKLEKNQTVTKLKN